MFLILLGVTFAVAVIVSLIVAKMFSAPAEQILRRIIPEDICPAWHRYLMFALFVVGVSSGVRIWELEKYITPPQFGERSVVKLTEARWVLEIYRTVIETLQGLTWVLLVFFIVSLIAYILVRMIEHRRERDSGSDQKSV